MRMISLLLSVRPERIASIRAELDAIPGVRAHDALPGSKLVVTVEDVPGHEPMAAMQQAQGLPGVLCATLTYEFSDDPLETLEART